MQGKDSRSLRGRWEPADRATGGPQGCRQRPSREDMSSHTVTPKGLKGGNLAQSHLGMPWKYSSRRVSSALEACLLDQSGPLVQTCTTALPWWSRVPAETEGVMKGQPPWGCAWLQA